MFRSYTNELKYNLRDTLDISEIIDILTSEDMENMPLESRMWFRMNFTSGVRKVIYFNCGERYEDMIERGCDHR